MIGIIRSILNYIAGLPAWFLALVLAVFTSLSDLGKDLFCWTIDEAFTLVEFILNSLPSDFGQFDPSAYFNALPQPLVNAASYIHLPQALAIIVAALAIRFLLQLIPFIRLGS